MSDYRVLVSCPLIQDAIDDYASLFEEHGISYDVPDVDQQLTEEDLLAVVDRYDGILAGDDELTERVLDRATNLEVISKWGIGVDNVDLDAASALGIEVHNTPGAFRSEVAGVVMGYALMLTRHLHHVDREVREGSWICPRGTSLAGKTFGVVGVGDIGSVVARRAYAFNMNVIGHDVEPLPEDLCEEIDIQSESLEELFSTADVVSLNCSLTPATRDLVGARELELLGRDGYLINAARGELIDQEALVGALQSGTIAGAALDVFEEEPLPADHPLTELDNVVLGSHNAQNTTEAVSAVNDRAVENLIDGLVDGEASRG